MSHVILLAILIPSFADNPLEEIIISDENEGSGSVLASIQRKLLSLDEHEHEHDEDPENVIPTLLIRPSDDSPGLFAYHNPTIKQEKNNVPNIRATRLAMACGLFSMRFYGSVVILKRSQTGVIDSLTVAQIETACCGSPDLRSSILSSLGLENQSVPHWLRQAAQNNYHDQSVVQKLADVMKNHDEYCKDEDDSGDERRQSICLFLDVNTESENRESREIVTMVPLCFNCRRPANDLCTSCHGVYFCGEHCRRQCWQHECFCATFRLYTQRRTQLSTFDLDATWTTRLTGREFRLSESPYMQFLAEDGVQQQYCSSWWRTEMGGWSGGSSDSAQIIDVMIRKSFEEGFHPIILGIPKEKLVTDSTSIEWEMKNEIGLMRLQSWSDYYHVRGIPDSSIAALLLTFPLTLYYSIVEYGQVPCTVARMLERPLRIHIVGAEKELNFLDLFREVIFLLPPDISLQLVFVVRQDMLPENVRLKMSHKLEIPLHERLLIILVAGTYGGSLDPDFDCGGSPDMVIAFNAGLFAYPSWRSVIEYLYRKPSVVGVFTDYNEMSGVQCASLGNSRESVQINPFRQPRAMPVYSMNLPQFCNGFIYAFNPQTFD